MNVDPFLDSNIFLYAFSVQDLSKQKRASDLVNAPAIISSQVINEVSNNMLKKFGFGNDEVAQFVIDCYEQYRVENISKETFVRASSLRDSYHFSYYDSLIVSAALLAGCTILYSEDMQNGLIVDGVLTIVNPFA